MPSRLQIGALETTMQQEATNEMPATEVRDAAPCEPAHGDRSGSPPTIGSA